MIELLIALGLVALGCSDAHKLDVSRPERNDVYAHVEQVIPSAESALYVTLTLSFHNLTSHEVKIKRYQITWNGGSFVDKPSDLRIAPMGVRQWRVRIGPSHGELGPLLNHRSMPVVHVE